MDNLQNLSAPVGQKAQDLYAEITVPKNHYKLTENLYFSPNYITFGLTILMIFLLILTFARLRHVYVHWSLKGSGSMIALGFILAILLEGLLLIGGKTFLTAIFGVENAPKPISTALDTGRQEFEEVLGVCDIDGDYKVSDLVAIYDRMPQDDQERVKENICH